MTRDQLDQQNSAVIRKWARTIADMGGTVPRGLLDDLATVAGHHVITEAEAAGPPEPRRARKAAAT